MGRVLRAAVAAVVTCAGLAFMVPEAQATSTFTFTRFEGANRFDTARLIAVNSFGTADTALIARGDLFPDALAGGYLAGHRGAPILLTQSGAVPAPTKEALSTLKTKNVILLGGTGAISPAVENDLKASNLAVRRIGGANRFDTARLVAQDPGPASVGSAENKKTAIVASGRNFPDALAGGPLAYGSQLPMILTEPVALSPEAKDALGALGIQQVLLLGGTAAVSQATEDAIKALNITVVRLAGANRTATATAIADYALGKLRFKNSHVNLARGDDFPDALAGGPHGGKDDPAPILLSTAPTALGTSPATWLKDHAATLTEGHILGGTGAVSRAVEAEATVAAGGGGANVTYSVSGQGGETQPVGGSRVCTAVLKDTPGSVDIRLFPAGFVSTDGAGNILFRDTPNDNVADVAAVPTVISAIEGAVAPNSLLADQVTPQGSTVVFTITSAAPDDMVAVVFADNKVENDTLDLDAVDKPIEPFGAGCRTKFIPSAAGSGSHPGVKVSFANRAEDYFVGQDGHGSETFRFDSGDSYLYRPDPSVQSVNLTQGQFEGILSPDDALDAQIVAEGQSTFTVTKDDVPAPTGVVAGVLNADNETTANDVRIEFNAVPTNGPETQFEVRRGDIAGADRVCGTGDDVKTEQGQKPGYNGIPRDNGGTLGISTSSPVTDFDVRPGCYKYTVRAANPSTSVFTESDFSNGVRVVEAQAPGAPSVSTDLTPPLSVDARLTLNPGTPGDPALLDAGDGFKVAFNEDMALPNPGDRITVRDPDLTVADIVNGSNATFSLNTASEFCGKDAQNRDVLCPAGRVLTVSLTGAPTVTFQGGSTRLTHFSSVADQSGNTDQSGNGYDVDRSLTCQPPPTTPDTRCDVAIDSE